VEVGTFLKAIPWLAIGTFAIGLVGILWLRARNRPVYDAVGRTVFEETHERV
jgi:hypothetical protein